MRSCRPPTFPIVPRPLAFSRVGRTGRLATDGHAFSFFTREMARLAPPLVELLEQHGQVGRGAALHV